MTRTRFAMTAGMFLAAAAAANAQVVISQVYGGGGNATAVMKHDFIEIYNKGAAAVDISGWAVQYASATGSTWAVTAIPSGVSLQPNGYYTIREAAGAGAVPDTVADLTTGTIAMSGTAGKVALTNTSTALSGTCPTGGAIVDFVGFGTTANCSETAPTPAPANNTSVIRTAGNPDTGNNSLDFVTQTPPTPRTGGAIAPPAADLAINAVTDSPDPLVGFPGNITYTFAGVSNAGPNNATGVTVTGLLPTGLTFVSCSVPGTTNSAGNITIPLGTINNGASSAGFTLVVSATQAFRAESLANVTWTVNYAGESTPANNSIRMNTEVIAPGDIVAGAVAKDDIAWGWNSVMPIATMKLVRNATNGTPALVRNGWRNLAFAQSVEFDNAGGVQRNPAGNLVALNFGTAATGGIVQRYNTADITAASGTVVGSWLDATTFVSGESSSLITRSRIGGLSFSPSNARVAFTGSDSGSIYVFDWNPAGPDFLTNGREVAAVAATGSTFGTRWLDNDTVMAACPGAGTDLRLRIFSVDNASVNLIQSNLLSAPGGGTMFTDVEYLAPVSPLVIVTAGRFATNVTNNTVFVFDTANANWQTDPPAGTFDYSGSINTLREIGYASNGDLLLGGAGPSAPTVEPLTGNTPALDKIPAATTLAAFATNNSSTYFFATNAADITLNMSVSFHGFGVAAGVGGGGPAGCNLADITEIGGTSETPGNPDNQLTVDDIIVFINLFSDGLGCPGAAPCSRADVTGIGGPPELPDGQLTVDDIIAFFNAFSDGCPA